MNRLAPIPTAARQTEIDPPRGKCLQTGRRGPILEIQRSADGASLVALDHRGTQHTHGRYPANLPLRDWPTYLFHADDIALLDIHPVGLVRVVLLEDDPPPNFLEARPLETTPKVAAAAPPHGAPPLVRLRLRCHDTGRQLDARSDEWGVLHYDLQSATGIPLALDCLRHATAGARRRRLPDTTDHLPAADLAAKLQFCFPHPTAVDVIFALERPAP